MQAWITIPLDVVHSWHWLSFSQWPHYRCISLSSHFDTIWSLTITPDISWQHCPSHYLWAPWVYFFPCTSTNSSSLRGNTCVSFQCFSPQTIEIKSFKPTYRTPSSFVLHGYQPVMLIFFPLSLVDLIPTHPHGFTNRIAVCGLETTSKWSVENVTLCARPPIKWLKNKNSYVSVFTNAFSAYQVHSS